MKISYIIYVRHLWFKVLATRKEDCNCPTKHLFYNSLAKKTDTKVVKYNAVLCHVCKLYLGKFVFLLPNIRSPSYFRGKQTYVGEKALFFIIKTEKSRVLWVLSVKTIGIPTQIWLKAKPSIMSVWPVLRRIHHLI